MIVNGSQLQAARSLADLTQSELAVLCGLTQNTISNLEKKRSADISGSTVDTLNRIERALNSCGVVLVDGPDGLGAVRRFS